MDLVEPFEDDGFEAGVLKSEMPVLVEFGAPWCAPCRAMAPTMKDLAEAYQGRLRVGTLDTDANQQTAARYNVRGVPTLILFKAGMPVDQVVGAVPRGKLQQMVNRHLD